MIRDNFMFITNIKELIQKINNFKFIKV